MRTSEAKGQQSFRKTAEKEARKEKASEISQLSEAKTEKASEHRKPMHEEASETKRTLKAVCKRVKTEEMRKYEAIGEEAAERRTQQECI
jgi:hypothetical protein